jgi:uncharacterized protein (TIGR02145 family)
MKKIIALFAVVIIVAACKKTSAPDPTTDKSLTASVITDINDPGINSSIRIGTQKWMTTNLAVGHYRNGDRIPQVKDAVKWNALTTGAWCWYNNNSATGAAYGKLYNWYAVHDPRGLAPTGWHIPGDAEWTTLTTFLGGEAIAGGEMKSTGTIEAGTGLWYAPNLNATNISGFTGLPGGYRNYTGIFYDIGFNGDWWSSESSTSYAWYRSLTDGTGIIYRDSYYEQAGFSVRCVRD